MRLKSFRKSKSQTIYSWFAAAIIIISIGTFLPSFHQRQNKIVWDHDLLLISNKCVLVTIGLIRCAIDRKKSHYVSTVLPWIFKFASLFLKYV